MRNRLVLSLILSIFYTVVFGSNYALSDDAVLTPNEFVNHLERLNRGEIEPQILACNKQAQMLSHWEKRYEEVRQYDEKVIRVKQGSCCTATTDGKMWITPSYPLLLQLKANRKIILNAAQLYGVDPRAIVGHIVSEGTLNHSSKGHKWVDDQVDDLIRKGISKTGQIMGREFSVGYGQIKPSTAMEVEDMAAQIERRPRRNLEEVTKLLVESPEASIRYLAALSRRAQDVYRKHGIDISTKPEIIATIVNIGEFEKLAQATVSRGGSPRVNNYGLYTERLLPLYDILLSQKPLPSEKDIVLPSASNCDQF